MMPEEWPIAAPQRSSPARLAGRGRLPTVRVDFFLDPRERLTEQERALMTAMVHCLIGDIAGELRAALPVGWLGVNDDDAALVEALGRSGLLDEPRLMALLLRRADEERIATAARARSGRREARVLQGLVSHEEPTISAAAMALILAKGRRRDRFGQCLAGFDDLAPETADHLVHAVAAVLRRELAGVHGASATDMELSAASQALLGRQDPKRSLEALTAALIAALDRISGLSDELLLACAQEGELGLIAEALARRAGLSGAVAIDELLAGSAKRLIALLRVAGCSRDLSAGLLASLGDLLGVGDPAAAIGLFDCMGAEEVKAAAVWLATAPAYRTGLDALGGDRG